jgi:hypothetical protein
MLILTQWDWSEYARLLREKWVKGDPAGSEAPRRLPNRPLRSERLERKSTGKINKAYHKKGSNHKQVASFYHSGWESSLFHFKMVTACQIWAR